MTGKTVIYTKQGCPYCEAARQHYTDLKIPFEEIDVHSTPGALDKVSQLSGGRNIVPVIVDASGVKVGFGGG